MVVNLEKAIKELVEDTAKREQMREASLKKAKEFPKSRFYNSFVEVFEDEGNGKK